MERYGTLEGFKSYHNDRGNDVGSLTDTQIEQSLLVSSEYLDNAFRSSWPGRKMRLREQIRDWPRYEAYDANYDWVGDGVPREVENATYEVAIFHANNPTGLLKNWTPTKYTRARIEGATDVNYTQFHSASDIQTRLIQVERILSNLLSSAKGGNISPLSGTAIR